MRKIIYVSGTRADFGLMASTLKLAANDPKLDISLCVTGMHLSPRFGETVHEIEESGLRICGRVPVEIEETSGATMARAIGNELTGMVDLFEQEQPDIVLVLGDRGEQLAGALAAIHLNIPVVHLHGGERSGTVDEPVRHAISKLSHYHLVATEGSKERLIRMGEREDRVKVVGAPGLDGLKEMAQQSRKELCEKYRLDSEKPIALMLFHPVLQEADQAGHQTRQLMDALLDQSLQVIALMPNADAGGTLIQEALENYRNRSGIQLAVHIPRTDFISWMSAADVMVGNSSSGIIEAATFGLPVVNVGSRQNGRERSGNVQDAPAEGGTISQALEKALQTGKKSFKNVYGDGQTGQRIVDLLLTLALTPDVLHKSNTY
ncbi:MAG: UDP-N-acetylglucosamine 2-epimerase [Nitrospinota bacterium]|nr:UDP-N-acetylglucosamine 2-epimerase [Nitrospinota bacterium]